jgi:hypothetical protein
VSEKRARSDVCEGHAGVVISERSTSGGALKSWDGGKTPGEGPRGGRGWDRGWDRGWGELGNGAPGSGRAGRDEPSFQE